MPVDLDFCRSSRSIQYSVRSCAIRAVYAQIRHTPLNLDDVVVEQLEAEVIEMKKGWNRVGPGLVGASAPLLPTHLGLLDRARAIRRSSCR